MMTEVSATGDSHLFQLPLSGAMVAMMAILKHVGTTDWDGERLNMSVNTPASWSTHALRTCLGMPSGLATLQGLTHFNILFGEGEPTDLGSRPRRGHSIILKVGKEDI
jgi:hypothetical protein